MTLITSSEKALYIASIVTKNDSFYINLIIGVKQVKVDFTFV